MSLTEEFEVIINKLRNEELKQYHVTKENFLIFRDVLVRQKDKEKIRGEALKGGDVIYTYDHSK
ncbi:hypothetical protein [Calidifontibacillus oryziterrae]|uniref:hypothetical protein n=1 Tax=Calidifontibacillus oryziterrae TaxID=1191699 RepID=UPI0002E1203C|nr:hypothetical protein [Calidifontibacillus oryziterrae]